MGLLYVAKLVNPVELTVHNSASVFIWSSLLLTRLFDLCLLTLAAGAEETWRLLTEASSTMLKHGQCKILTLLYCLWFQRKVTASCRCTVSALSRLTALERGYREQRFMLFIHVLITNLYLANALHSDTSVSSLADAYYPPCLSEIQQYVHTITGPLIRHTLLV